MGTSGSHWATRSLNLYNCLFFITLPSMASVPPDHRGLEHSGFWIGEPVWRLVFAIPLLSMSVPDNLFEREIDNIVKPGFVALDQHGRLRRQGFQACDQIFDCHSEFT